MFSKNEMESRWNRIESVLEMLDNPRMRNSKYELQSEHIHRVLAKDILESMFSCDDYCWVDEQDIPLTHPR